MKLNLDKVKNFNNLGERDLHLIAEDIVTIKDKLVEDINNLSFVKNIAVHNKNNKATKSSVTTLKKDFKDFVDTFNSLEEEILDKDLKAALRKLSAEVKFLKEREYNRPINRIKRFFRKIKDFFKKVI